MGNCCGSSDFPEPRGQPLTPSGAPPPANVMTPAEADRRHTARAAAEERARQNAVRGTQRTTPKRKPVVHNNSTELGANNGPDISDWT